MTTNSDEIISAFEAFQKTFEEDQKIREKIHENVVELDQLVRQTMTILQGIHLETSGNYGSILSKAKTNLSKIGKVDKNLYDATGGNFYRYHDHWKNLTQKAVFCVALIIFLESRHLASKLDVAQELSLCGTPKEGFHLDLEDYLHGLLQLVSELSRLAVNSAAGGDYTLPVEISQFVTELNAGFRLINFKNDSLRKHYDCFKYDLKKIEEVVYDLHPRSPLQGRCEDACWWRSRFQLRIKHPREVIVSFLIGIDLIFTFS